MPREAGAEIDGQEHAEWASKPVPTPAGGRGPRGVAGLRGPCTESHVRGWGQGAGASKAVARHTHTILREAKDRAAHTAAHPPTASGGGAAHSAQLTSGQTTQQGTCQARRRGPSWQLHECIVAHASQRTACSAQGRLQAHSNAPRLAAMRAMTRAPSAVAVHPPAREEMART